MKFEFFVWDPVLKFDGLIGSNFRILLEKPNDSKSPKTKQS